MPKLDDAYRDQLTAEEITAFEAENEDDAAEALEALANGETDDDPDDEDDTPPAAQDDTSPTGDDDPNDDDDPVVQEEPQKPAAKEEAKPEPQAEPVPDAAKAKQTLDAIKMQRKELRDKYDDGDLTDEEYDAQIEALDDKMADAAADIKTAERHMAKQQDAWKAAGKAYLDRYPGLKTQGVIQALDKAVQELAAYPSVASLPHEQFLERVHKKLIAEAEYTGLDIPAIGKSTPQKEKQKPAGDESLGKAPKTLASVPSSDVSSLDDSPYASLERMAERGDPIAFEEAMAKLPADKRDQFASMLIE
jgi:hypothetical protein